MLREIISRCKNVKYCAGNFTQDFGLDSMNILINENIVYKMNFKDYVLKESLVRQEYNYNIIENCKQNLRRNNIIFASYQCIVNSLILICLFMIIGITGII